MTPGADAAVATGASDGGAGAGASPGAAAWVGGGAGAPGRGCSTDVSEAAATSPFGSRPTSSEPVATPFFLAQSDSEIMPTN